MSHEGARLAETSPIREIAMRWIVIGIACLLAGCAATVPAGFGKPSIYDADGNRKGYITEGALGQQQVRDTRGVLLYEIHD